jgi:DNA repair exonuclease SbcCD ATPase subunit
MSNKSAFSSTPFTGIKDEIVSSSSSDAGQDSSQTQPEVLVPTTPQRVDAIPGDPNIFSQGSHQNLPVGYYEALVNNGYPGRLEFTRGETSDNRTVWNVRFSFAEEDKDSDPLHQEVQDLREELEDAKSKLEKQENKLVQNIARDAARLWLDDRLKAEPNPSSQEVLLLREELATVKEELAIAESDVARLKEHSEHSAALESRAAVESFDHIDFLQHYIQKMVTTKGMGARRVLAEEACDDGRSWKQKPFPSRFAKNFRKERRARLLRRQREAKKERIPRATKKKEKPKKEKAKKPITKKSNK